VDRFAPATLATVHGSSHQVKFWIVRQAAASQLQFGPGAVVVEKTVKPVFGRSQMNFPCVWLNPSSILERYIGLFAPSRSMISAAEVKTHMHPAHRAIRQRKFWIARHRFREQLHRSQ
jgi:hypothetical protein